MWKMVQLAAHGDIITLLMGASADGLEILTKEENGYQLSQNLISWCKCWRYVRETN